MADWPERSGSMRYRPERITSAEAEGGGIATQVIDQVYALDLVIEKYAYGLELIQPSAPGKIAVRFLQRRGGGGTGRHPVFIQWHKSANGYLLYTRYKPNEILRRVKTYTLMEPVAPDTRELIRHLKPIMEKRERLLETFYVMTKAMKSAQVRSEVSRERYDKEIEDWLPLLLEKHKELKESWKSWLADAHEKLPLDAVPDSKKQPRYAIGGKTRPFKHPTHHPRRATNT